MFFITRHNGALPYTRYYPLPGSSPAARVGLCQRLGSLLSHPIASLKAALKRGWCGGRSCNDRLIKIVCFIGLVMGAVTGIWAGVNLAANSTLESEESAQWAGPVERGLQSQSQRNWYDTKTETNTK